MPRPDEPPFLIRRQVLLSGPLTTDDPPHDYFSDYSPGSARQVPLLFATSVKSTWIRLSYSSVPRRGPRSHEMKTATGDL